MNTSISTQQLSRRPERAFTMVEIAIAIGVIGFALVAIIGVLPAGLNVQKDIGEDTTISQDAPFFMEAIRNGGTNIVVNELGVAMPTLTSLDFLTNYVEGITITSVSASGAVNVYNYTNVPGTGFTLLQNGRMILSLLSLPKWYPGPQGVTNTVMAHVRALSGPAMQQNGANSITAFRYHMAVDLEPFHSFSADSIDFADYPTNSPDFLIRTNRYLEVQSGVLSFNLFELRLRFTWPLTNGPSRQSYRTLIAGHLAGLGPSSYFPVTPNPQNLFQSLWYTNGP